ncbi:MAG: hypothetical protein CL936_11120 [Deltaproteobacteria bacterium]|nr:hypothetical protein [Deltaproteobacteria bacterium]
MNKMLNRKACWEILAKMYLHNQHQNTYWDKSKYLSIVMHFNGFCLDVIDGFLCDMRFKSCDPKVFQTPVVRLQKFTVRRQNVWLYLEDIEYVQYVKNIMIQYADTKQKKLKTTYFNFPNEMVVKDIDHQAIDKIGKPSDVTDGTEVVVTFVLQCNNQHIVPILKEIKYIYY